MIYTHQFSKTLAELSYTNAKELKVSLAISNRYSDKVVERVGLAFCPKGCRPVTCVVRNFTTYCFHVGIDTSAEESKLRSDLALKLGEFVSRKECCNETRYVANIIIDTYLTNVMPTYTYRGITFSILTAEHMVVVAEV